MADRVGQQLGNYRLVRLLGRGGFAEVYLGEHIYLDTQAAVKVLYTYLASDELEKFRDEARTIARLEHPHIVRVLDFGVEDDVPFLVMNYGAHGTLRQRHPRGTQLQLNTIVTYVKQIADALLYAHEEKLIHRDIKPENMLLGRRDDVLLSDFGLATLIQSTHSLGKTDVAGTATYMAPEQFRGKPTAASDQYALGVVVYEWLSGDYPFHGNAIEAAMQHMLTPPIPLHEKLPTIAPAVEQVVLRALEKEPYKRFESVQTFADALEEASRSEQAQQASTVRPTIEVKPIVADEETFRTAALSEVLPHATVPTPSPMGTTVCVYQGHTAPVRALTWSPSGPYIASGSNDQTMHIWNALTAVQALLGHGHTSWVHAVAWSPDRKHLASGSWDNTVQIWDVITGNRQYTYRGHSKNVNTVAWDLSSRHIASGGYDRTVQVWDADTGRHVYTYAGHSSAVTSITWSWNGKRIASASYDQSVQVWDATDGDHLFTYHGHAGGVDTVAWSPHGKWLASGSKDGTVQVWEETRAGVFAKGKVTTYRGHTGAVHALAWSPDGKHIVSGGKDSTVQIWEADTGHPMFTYRAHRKQVNAVAWSPDGKYIASAGDDKTVRVWKAVNML
jgi:eukaryotic-like serine/threonine-protein kinase